MIERLIDEIVKKNAPVVVGLDPTLSLIPPSIKEISYGEHGKNLYGAADAALRFNIKIIDSIKDLVPAVKPQIAMYEQFGVPGLITYEKTVKYAHENGLLVIGDTKRGDIGSTSKAYAVSHLGRVDIDGEEVPVFDTDFTTVNPYLGSDGVSPFIECCKEYDKGIFVLIKTSNKSSGELQDRVLKETDLPLYETVADLVSSWGEDTSSGDYLNVGAVIGATYKEIGEALRKKIKKSYILVPGYGAQGGTAEDLKPFFNPDGLGAIVNSSRGIIAAWQNEKYKRIGEDRFYEASRQATLDMINDIRRII